MSTPVTLSPGTLPEGYCYPESPQTLNVDIVTRILAFMSATFPGVYVSDTEPPADQRDRVWFNTTVQKWYWYINGNWMRKYDVDADSDVEWLWKGAEADLITFAGGSAGVVNDATGPLWEVDHEIDGRALVGPGTIPGTAFTIAINATSDSNGGTGVYEVTLTEAQGAVGQHTHAFGVSHAGNDDAYFHKLGAANIVPSYLGYYITGSNGNIEVDQTTADLFTSPSGMDGNGVVTVAHNNMQPYIGRFVIKRTARVYVLSPY
jgi:hypothetical protein